MPPACGTLRHVVPTVELEMCAASRVVESHAVEWLTWRARQFHLHTGFSHINIAMRKLQAKASSRLCAGKFCSQPQTEKTRTWVTHYSTRTARHHPASTRFHFCGVVNQLERHNLFCGVVNRLERHTFFCGVVNHLERCK